MFNAGNLKKKKYIYLDWKRAFPPWFLRIFTRASFFHITLIANLDAKIYKYFKAWFVCIQKTIKEKRVMKTFWIKLSIDVSRNSGDVSHKYLLHGRLILSSLVWLQTKLDSTQSYYLNLFKIENMPNKNVEKVIKGSWSYVSWYLLSL